MPARRSVRCRRKHSTANMRILLAWRQPVSLWWVYKENGAPHAVHATRRLQKLFEAEALFPRIRRKDSRTIINDYVLPILDFIANFGSV